MTLQLQAHADLFRDTKSYAKRVVDYFTEWVNEDEALKAHRDYIEKHAYGFGERPFHWLWKLIVDEMPRDFRFLEIGVYKGQVLSLVRMLAPEADVVGVTMLSSFSGVMGKFSPFPDEDYEQHITALHDHFGLRHPTILIGDSTCAAVHTIMSLQEPFDVVYIDGCHEYGYVVSDLMFYPTLLKPGGLLVVDDSACYLKQPWGYFQGIEDVSLAVRTVIETDPQYEHLLAVMHNRVWRKQ